MLILKRYYKIFIAFIVIGIAMLFPFPLVPDKYNIDKIAHFTIFALFTLVVFKTLCRACNTPNSKLKIITTLIVLIIISTAFEYLQIFIPRRGFNYNDLFANWSGITAGFVLVLLWKKLKK